MVRFNLPVLLAEIASVLLLPTWTLPKLRFEVLEVEELRASCPAAAIEHKRTLSRITLGQENLHSKPELFSIVPPLMLRARGTAGDMGRLHCGPDRKGMLAVKLTQGTVSLCSPSHLNSDRYRKDMRHYHWYMYQNVQKDPSIVALELARRRSAPGGLEEGLLLIDRECARYAPSLWKSVGVAPAVNLQSNPTERRCPGASLVDHSLVDHRMTNGKCPADTPLVSPIVLPRLGVKSRIHG